MAIRGKLWYIHAVEYYTAMYIHVVEYYTAMKTNRRLPFATTMSESHKHDVGQKKPTLKSTYHIIPFL